MPLIPDLPSSDNTQSEAPLSSKATQKLASQRASVRTTQTWWSRLAQPMSLPHATQMGLSAVIGALAVVMASLSINWIFAREPLRDLFGRRDDEAALQIPERAALPPLASAQTAIEVQPAASAWSISQSQPVEVEGANEDGTALAALEPLNEDDLRRIEKRREDDRMLREKRVLEDRKRAIERQLEDKQLEERRRGEDVGLLDGRRDEDRKRIEARLEEDRRLFDERNRQEKEALAAAQRADNAQLAEVQR